MHLIDLIPFLLLVVRFIPVASGEGSFSNQVSPNSWNGRFPSYGQAVGPLASASAATAVADERQQHPLLDQELSKLLSQHSSVPVPPSSLLTLATAQEPLPPPASAAALETGAVDAASSYRQTEALEGRIAELQHSLEALQSEEQRLRADNGILKQEIDRWQHQQPPPAPKQGLSPWGQRAAAAAAARSKAPQTSQHAASTAPSKDAKAPKALLELPSVDQHAPVVAGGPDTSILELQLQLWQVLTIIGCLLLLVVACYSHSILPLLLSVGKKKPKAASASGKRSEQSLPTDWRDRLSQSVPDLQKHPSVSDALRYAGIASYSIHISEVHVGGLLSARSLYLRVQDGRGREVSSSIVDQEDAPFVKFRDSFVLEVRHSDAECIFAVMDATSGEALGLLAFPPRELITLAQRRNRQFFRAELRAPLRGNAAIPELPPQADAPGSTSNPSSFNSLRPYLAMRLAYQDVALDPSDRSR
eukprot:CAMPEP_0206475712 /NCGR_PEP_ID=MMETSP0324_2-20121206/34255_1 /ASSEMBLY_ACC=CAM_ASM_000836 /TAXON_ID=2866 /ORGANISM="Crypthecodinium cohnii, Strain Seligo" /LENGTH=474 /DNA_ID=CAMNT_0053951147 /DNA_START=23 /DNA_END=1443 /DNA_ORIENTATION=-